MADQVQPDGSANDEREPFPRMSVQLYAAHMEEIKQRSEAITASLKTVRGAPDDPRAFMQAEFAYLQLRYICELVALSSLAAHHDLGLGAKLSKKWNAAEAFALLEHINPHCFPNSVRNIPDNKGVHNFHVTQGPGILRRSDLARIYSGCGEMLHRGMIKDAMAGRVRQYDLTVLDGWHRQLMQLLTQHMILIRDPDRTLLVNFHSDDGKVAVYSAEAVEFEDLSPEARAALGDGTDVD